MGGMSASSTAPAPRPAPPHRRSTPTKDDEVADAVGAHQWFGVVNCGGNGGEIATPQDTDMAVYDRVMAINARGTLLVTKFAAPGMIEAGCGVA